MMARSDDVYTDVPGTVYLVDGDNLILWSDTW
jgi:hypothetical protein